MKPIRNFRPVAVTVISYLMLACAPLEILMLIDTLRDGADGWNDPVFMTYGIASPVVHATCGLFMLRGANWARILFFTACIPLIVLWLFQMGIAAALEMIPRVVVALLVSTRLLSQEANRFFTDRDTIFARQRIRGRKKSEPISQDVRYDY